MSPKVSIRLLAAQSDARLVALARDGHERAFEALVQRYRRPLLRYCQRLLGSEARAEDVLQQALLQAWIALGRGVEVQEPRPWLYRIVHNAALNAIRGSTNDDRRLTVAFDEHQLDAHVAGCAGAQSLEPDLGRGIAAREALASVAALPRMQRDAILLSAVGGDSHEQVASALGITDGAVRGLLYRARATLRNTAAAIIPQPLINWAASGAGRSTPMAERLAELTGGAGAAGISSVLLKSAVAAVSAGVLVTGTGVVPGVHGHRRAVHAPPQRVALADSTASSPAARSFGFSSLDAPAFPGASTSHVSGRDGNTRRIAHPRGAHGEQRRSGRSGGDPARELSGHLVASAPQPLESVEHDGARGSAPDLQRGGGGGGGGERGAGSGSGGRGGSGGRSGADAVPGSVGAVDASGDDGGGRPGGDGGSGGGEGSGGASSAGSALAGGDSRGPGSDGGGAGSSSSSTSMLSSTSTTALGAGSGADGTASAGSDARGDSGDQKGGGGHSGSATSDN